MREGEGGREGRQRERVGGREGGSGGRGRSREGASEGEIHVLSTLRSLILCHFYN